MNKSESSRADTGAAVVVARVTSQWHGALSYPEFLEFRKQRFLELKRQLDDLPIPTLSKTLSRPQVYFGTDLTDWIAAGSGGTVWLPTAPALEAPVYPVFLDVAESAKVLAGNKLLRSVCDALAPTWEDLETFGLTDPESSRPRLDDVDGDSEGLLGTFLLGALARCLASLGPGFGVVFRQPQHYDEGSEMFVARLLREARLTGLCVAFEAPSRRALDGRYRSLLGRVECVHTKKSKKNISPGTDNRAVKFVALCAQGVPIHVLRSLCEPASLDFLPTCQGPAGEAWAFLPSTIKRAVKARLQPDVSRQLHSELFQAWPHYGWGYLRRASHAFAGNDRKNVLKQHTTYVYGMAAIGSKFVYRQFVELSRNAKTLALDERDYRQLMVGTARLCAMASGRGPVAIQYYKRALRGAEPNLAVNVMYAIANVYARSVEPAALAQAQHWCALGNSILPQIVCAIDRLYAGIRLANVLALAEYHAGDNEKALSHERRAHSLALQATSEHSLLGKWAKPVVNANTAKLLEKRFADTASAMELLEENLSVDEPSVEEHARIELARLHFDQRNYFKVVDLLSKDYEGQWSSTFNEQRELFGQLMLCFALETLGEKDRARRQFERVTYLHQVISPIDLS